VILWQRYQRGDRTSLDLLLKYNREDVINLEVLMEQAYEMQQERLLPGNSFTRDRGPRGHREDPGGPRPPKFCGTAGQLCRICTQKPVLIQRGHSTLCPSFF
jgi:hypothetical protein